MFISLFQFQLGIRGKVLKESSMVPQFEALNAEVGTHDQNKAFDAPFQPPVAFRAPGRLPYPDVVLFAFAFMREWSVKSASALLRQFQLIPSSSLSPSGNYQRSIRFLCCFIRSLFQRPVCLWIFREHLTFLITSIATVYSFSVRQTAKSGV